MCTDTHSDLYTVCLLMTLFLRGKFQSTRKSFTHSTPVFRKHIPTLWAGQRSQYSDWLRAGRSGDRIPVGARFSAPVPTGPGAHPTSCTMGTGSFPGVKSGRGVTLTPHPFQCRSQERVELYLYSPYGPYGLYRASVPVQGCTLPYLTLNSRFRSQ